MRKTNTNLSNYDDFLKYSLLHNVVSGQEKTPETKSFRGPSERRRPDLNRWILVLQTIAFCSRKAPILCFLRLGLKINHPITTLFCHLNSKCQ